MFEVSEIFTNPVDFARRALKQAYKDMDIRLLPKRGCRMPHITDAHESIDKRNPRLVRLWGETDLLEMDLDERSMDLDDR